MNSIAWQRPSSPESGVVVCIPVSNQADRILACLDALADQDFDQPFEVLLLVHNCTDGTAALARAFFPPPLMTVHIEERWFPQHLANPGHARHVAMKEARQIAGASGVMLGTDADAVVPLDWVRRNVELLAAGADAVAGRTVIDHVDLEPATPRMRDEALQVQHLERLLDVIDSMADPAAHDPSPRHAEHSGASTAVTAAAFDAAGGIPLIPVGEDRAFFAALRRTDARIRHAPDIVVAVSGRRAGRVTPDGLLDDSLEPAEDRFFRATLRADLRLLRQQAKDGVVNLPELRRVAGLLELPAAILQRLLACDTFGSLWQALEAHRPVLRHRHVRAASLRAEINAAGRILERGCATPAGRTGQDTAAIASHRAPFGMVAAE